MVYLQTDNFVQKSIARKNSNIYDVKICFVNWSSSHHYNHNNYLYFLILSELIERDQSDQPAPVQAVTTRFKSCMDESKL